MPYKLHLAARWLLLAVLVMGATCPVFGAGTKILHGHIPEAIRHLSALGRLPATNELHLAIGVPLRDPEGLQQFLADVYDPASPNYRQFLTPDELTARFGPTESDYAAVENFALTNGFKVTGKHSNRLLLDVSGRTPDVEKAFHFHLQRFQHPTEAREFFAPDTEPTVDASLPVADIQGLSDYVRLHPKLIKTAAVKARFKAGSAPDGSGEYFGNDFRSAYAPGATLTGAGQMVGVFQADGYYANDIASYAAAAGSGRTNIVIQAVLIDGYNGTPTTGADSGNDEVSLDIEMAMAMAPGLSKIVVFEGNPNDYVPNDILNTMAASNTVKNLSCSWGWGGGPSTTTDSIFQLMAAEGQSFFNASGDTDAFVSGSNNDVDSTSQANAPSSSPYITQVGGTDLSVSGTTYASEKVWNEHTVNSSGGNWGSSGGVSTYYAIPSWQTNISMTANGGSTTHRNIPDVALTATNVYIISDNGSPGMVRGTSCAAPLWAGFMALVNQQAAANGNAPAGFINPAIYALVGTANYASCFHDTAAGDNAWSGSSGNFSAVSGYDLCTGLGTPTGQNLINVLAASGDALGIAPWFGYSLSGPLGGGFSPSAGNFQLTNSSSVAFNWSLVNTSAWLKVAFTNGTLAGHTVSNLNVSLTVTASNLAVGSYSTSLAFSNKTSHSTQRIPFAIQIYQPLIVTPVKGFTAVGAVGGAFSPNLQSFTLTNVGSSTLKWSLINTSSWLSVSSSNGVLAVGGQTNVNISLSASANTLVASVYNASVLFSNATGVAAVVPFTLSVGQPVIQNGGFETGDFTDWTESGNTADVTVSTSSSFVHGGTYGAKVGPSGSPGYLSQNLTTVPGQNYLLSLWLRNPTGEQPNLFQVQWNGTAIYNVANLTMTGWTNLQFLVTATGASSVLQLGFQDDPDYLGIDDVTVTSVTNPAFKSTVRKLSSFMMTFNASTGLVYQVQYATNLPPLNWFNLGSPVTATTNIITLSDTNAVASPQRFYRLQVTP